MSFFGENKFLYIQRIYNVFRFKPYMIVYILIIDNELKF